MAQNLELKAQVSSLRKAELIAAGIGARFVGSLRQVDTYFEVLKGRLKLRVLHTDHAQLIYYQRTNRKGNRYSHYEIYSLGDVSAAKKILNGILRPFVVVRKTRKLYLYRNARIHLDSVQRLGGFLEFEVIVKRGKPQAARLLHNLRTIFKIRPQDVIAGSYSDLLAKKTGAMRS
ncbi:MAG: class IV adenylate cyclase [Ignavibacteriales bacterium]|nr:class IV adenylate cyclase [Ignavibacteriales bacterium]